MANKEIIAKAYEIAKEQYATLGVDTDAVLKKINEIKISLHCWQTDDVSGSENPDGPLSGGIQATGNYPGKARNVTEVMADLEKVMSMLPGKQRVNVHALYGDFSKGKVDRDRISVKQFQGWIDWCKKQDIGMDFNGSFFSHPKAGSGFTLSSKNEEIRKFWVEHLKRSREIAAEVGKQLGSPCILNTWIPDGSKDTPVDRNGMRSLLTKSLDEGMAQKFPKEHMKDAVESKVFGIGAESMTVGSHDYYLGYAIKNNKLICLDNGHFHPTEVVGDKISSCLQFVDEVLLHVTRPVRWDSDHVVTLNEEVQLIASEIVRNDFINRVNIGLDFFDASINRIGAYVIGTRATQKAFMIAMLEPTSTLVRFEENNQNFERLALLEELKTKPFGAVWDYYCLQEGVPIGEDYITEIQSYENEVLSRR
ncbi:L-rhamnose isomerase [Saccharicrinis fermentans]|uniref:L-rhamnose isomerase n=1 Tax=Saccharicrinis fermentans DSM 9555 = JCM 21142 TaxID=869213 RepID=W7YHS1_9BACT|nr:L-rhamnose isomerase [Saccharicrinis fermentans]GAF02099.1 L-rhamnose isomerase [Saccharicrinis fermentans DSM 9555 = JCM 21142]